MQFDRPGFEKTNEQIIDENKALASEVHEAMRSGQSTDALAHGLLAIHTRLGDLFMWMKERR